MSVMILTFSAGVLLGFIVSDAVLQYTVYTCFKRQRRLFVPGYGLNLGVKCIKIMQHMRTRLFQLNQLACSFPLKSSHCNATRNLVTMIKNSTNVGSHITRERSRS